MGCRAPPKQSSIFSGAEEHMAEQTEEHAVLCSDREGIATVTLNRPSALNALNEGCKRDIAEHIRRIDLDPSVRCVILTGAGRAFCAGGDLKEIGPDSAALATRVRIDRLFRYVMAPLVRLEKPVIAALNGPCVGAGCSLALTADYIIASTTATFTQNFTQIGLLPDAGSAFFLTRLVGLNTAKEICFSGRTIGAKDAFALGLYQEVVEPADLMSCATEKAAQFAGGSAAALAMTKTLLNRAVTATFDEFIELEPAMQGLATTTPEFAAAVHRFRRRSEDRKSQTEI
jgi:2-(1,2-epoxy-1,2-dihydrophenyl)acetyl-CoA isomerase